MSKSKLNQKWRNIQANMALEGHYIPDELLEEAAEEYEKVDGDRQVEEALKLAKSTGITFSEAFKQILAVSPR